MISVKSAATTALVMCLLVAPGCGAPPPIVPQEDALYIWQRVWNDDTRESVTKGADAADHLMVLAMEAETAPIQVDWSVLATTEQPITLVFRYPRLAADPSQVDRVASDISNALDRARASGLNPLGVQLDFDSPTSKLPQYAALLKALRPQLDDHLELSITTLPTWLGSPDFAPLVKLLDYFVLQVHSFDPPQSIKSPLILCDTAKLDGYVSEASAAEGQFAGLSAEGPGPSTWPPGYQTREVRAVPADLASAVARLRAAPPDWYRGNLWFRMPVASDTRNWNWSTLRAVMEGRAPSVEYAIEVRHPDPGLAEIWITNLGEDAGSRTVTIHLEVPREKTLAWDGINGFRAPSPASAESVNLTGPAPVEKVAQLVAWYRMADETSAQTIVGSIVGGP